MGVALTIWAHRPGRPAAKSFASNCCGKRGHGPGFCGACVSSSIPDSPFPDHCVANG